MEPRYGVKIYFPDGEFLWVTQGDSKFQLAPLLFDSRAEAERYALTVWGDGAIVAEYIDGS
jgi:hypothetical protein